MVATVAGWAVAAFLLGLIVGAAAMWRYGKGLSAGVPRATVPDAVAVNAPVRPVELQDVARRLESQYGAKFTSLNATDRAAMVARTVQSARRALGGRA